jgi:hypothetical protein
LAADFIGLHFYAGIHALHVTGGGGALINPIVPPTGPATGSFNGFHLKF